MVRRLQTRLQREKERSRAQVPYILKNLRQAGFIREENKDGKTIVYSLTPRGEGALKIAKRRFTRTFLGVFP
jgi:DNA-binding PadR family transcriptional regulator